jgi:hypothetical protein
MGWPLTTPSGGLADCAGRGTCKIAPIALINSRQRNIFVESIRTIRASIRRAYSPEFMGKIGRGNYSGCIAWVWIDHRQWKREDEILEWQKLVLFKIAERYFSAARRASKRPSYSKFVTAPWYSSKTIR